MSGEKEYIICKKCGTSVQHPLTVIKAEHSLYISSTDQVLTIPTNTNEAYNIFPTTAKEAYGIEVQSNIYVQLY